HTIAAPVSRFWFTEGPHNTAVIRDSKSGGLWAGDPRTHKRGEGPRIFPPAKRKNGDEGEQKVNVQNLALKTWMARTSPAMRRHGIAVSSRRGCGDTRSAFHR